jgi:outer membrane lipase/esterase
VFSAQAFTSLWVFGDGISTTTDPASWGPPSYYGQRWTNGRIWVEVLAQRQGLTYDPNKERSYFDQESSALVSQVNNFTAPGDVSTALFVVWVNNCDLEYNVAQYGNNLGQWNAAIAQNQANHLSAIQTLYNKGVRTVIMPNAVDISKVPYFANAYPSFLSFIHQRCIDYNNAFYNTINQLRASYPSLTIYVPDAFGLLNDVVANPANYGLTHPTTDALHDLTNPTWTGPGASYVFWDQLDPSAKLHARFADITQQMLTKPIINKITRVNNGTNRLDMAGIPVGLNGYVDGTADFVSWTARTNINSTAVMLTNYVLAPDPMQVYRLRFPFAWSWP